jgi:hypothetical protein
MKRKLKKLDKIELEFDPRPMTVEEKLALEKYILKEKQKSGAIKKIKKYKKGKNVESHSYMAAEPKAKYEKRK